ncbi:MAG: hypothetical protein WBZ29_10105 [Methanocella sp.]
MRKLTASDMALKWVQPRARSPFFELRANDDALATLSREKLFGTLATAQTAEKTWTFKRVGFLQTRVTVRSPGYDADLATFKPAWSYSGTLDIQGRPYAWKQLSFMGTKWGFVRPDGAPIVTFKHAGGLDTIFKLEADVEISPGEVSINADLPLLLTLGWYIMVMMADDTMAAAVVTTTI